MATIVAAATGAWSAGATWTGGVKPGVGDIAQTGAYTVTIDQDVTCTTIEATSSGHFEVTSGGKTINANYVMNTTYPTNGGLRCTHAAGTVTLNGNVTGGAQVAVGNNAAGTLTIVGTVTGGGGSNCLGVKNASSGILNVTGNVTAGSGSASHGIQNASTGTVNITGDVAAAAGSGTQGVNNYSTGTVTITGNVASSGGAGTCYGAYNAVGGTINISGTSTGGSVATNVGAYNVSTGTISVDKAVGGSAFNTPGLSGAVSGGTTTYKHIGSQANGNSALHGFCKMALDADYNVIVVKDSAGDDISMSNDYPAVTDVKDGVIYNRTTLEGTYVGASGGFQQSGQGFGFKR
jgi:hypothetical protein